MSADSHCGDRRTISSTLIRAVCGEGRVESSYTGPVSNRPEVKRVVEEAFSTA